MTTTMFITLLCSLLKSDCQERAAEYWATAAKYDFDPVLLVAIDYYECDLREKPNSNKYPRDICPMGLRVYKSQKIMNRAEILDKATERLAYFRSVIKNHEESYAFLNHYNSGWRHIKNKYGWQVIAIYNTFYQYPLTEIENRNLNSRTKLIIKELHNASYYRTSSNIFY